MFRRVLFWILFFVFVWVVIAQFDEIKMFAQTLSQGRPGWILLAFVLVAQIQVSSATNGWKNTSKGVWKSRHFLGR